MPNPNPKKKDIIAKRRQLVAKYRVAGMNQDQIKAMLEKEGIIVNRSTVSTDIKALREGWTVEAQEDIKKLQAETLVKIEQLELEAWSLFNKAKKEGKSGGNTAGYWHSEILKTIDQKMKLLGIPKPETKQPININNIVNGKVEELTDEQLILIINGQAGSGS